MWPQVVQFETRQLQRELQLTRERRSTRARLETAPRSTGATSLRLLAFPRRPGWSLRADTRRA